MAMSKARKADHRKLREKLKQEKLEKQFPKQKPITLFRKIFGM